MAVEAELADGSVLEFPDGTSPQVVQATVKKMIASQGGATPTATQTAAPVAAPQPAKPTYQPSAIENITGAVVEPLMTMGTGLVAKPISDIAGIGAIFADYLGLKKNDPTAVKRSVEEAMTYQPRTAGGQTVVQNVLAPIGGAIESGAQKIASTVTDNPIAQAGVKEAALQGLGFLGVKNAPVVSRGAKAVVADTTADIAKSKAFTKQAAAQAASSADWERAAVIEAAKIARKNNIVMNPALVNPSRASNVRVAATGGSDVFDTAASIANKPRWNKMAREEMGLGKDVPLDESAYKLALSKVSKPYEDVANIGTIASKSEDALKAIREIDVPDILPAGEQAGGKVKRITDSIAEKIESGEMTGANMLKTIKDLRTDVSSTREAIKSGTRQVTNVERDAMHAKSRLIDELEKITSENIADPKWRQGFNESRRKMAQIYALRDATDLATFQIDPMVFATEMARPNFLTGAAKEMGQIAANAPGIANINAKSGYVMKMPSRSGPAGTAGYALGAVTPVGSVPASALAAVIGAVGGKRYARGLMTPEAQARLTTPIDRRIKPVKQPQTGPTGAVVPYVSPTEVVGEMPYRPNFTRGKVSPEPTFTGPDYQQPQIGMSQEPVGGQIGALRAEDARVRDLSMRQGRAAEAAQVAAEAAAPRQPTRGGMLFDLDPVTGKLRAADQGVKGATPEIFQADTGASLRSASEKVASGRTFDMTAAEKVAWNKTAVDIQEALPEFKGLSDKQVQAKMADRQWVQQTIEKVQQKEQMFAQLAERAQDQLARSMARIQREKMSDLLEQLQDTLSAGRPVSSGMQGPKTRAFKRGLLTGENQ